VPSSSALLGGFAIVHGFCCYDNLAPKAKCERVLDLALCLVVSYNTFTLSYMQAWATRTLREDKPMYTLPENSNTKGKGNF